MLGWPGSDWVDTSLPRPSAPPLDTEWQQIPGEVRHTFTHFHLILDVMVARVTDVTPARGQFVPRDQFRPSDLPTVMRKAFDLAQK